MDAILLVYPNSGRVCGRVWGSMNDVFGQG